jgi:hypothetical protein
LFNLDFAEYTKQNCAFSKGLFMATPAMGRADSSYREPPPPPPPPSRTFYALREFYSHVVMVAGILLGIWALEHLHLLLWPGTKSFDLFGLVIPVRWLIDMLDLSTIGGVGVFGTWATLKTYWGL